MKTMEIKAAVRQSYGAIAKENKSGSGCCSDASCCGSSGSNPLVSGYRNQAGYQEEADLGLGCGIPTETAGIKAGDTVVDLGSGAGNDAFIARRLVGPAGRVIGVDMTIEMVELARENNRKLGFGNIEFYQAEIEDMQPIESDTADVVISNCVMNLVVDKQKAFSEVYRVLKQGGHFSISDIVTDGPLPPPISNSTAAYTGCIAGAVERGQYLGLIKDAGFKNIRIERERLIDRADGTGIYSITVTADKETDGACCETSGQGCCR